jgi:integrase
MRVHVRNAKGNKDRFVPLPTQTLLILRRFWRLHQHPTLIFPNRKGGLKKAYLAKSHLNMGGVQVTMAAVVKEMGLKKRSPAIH